MEGIFYHSKCKAFTVISQCWFWQSRNYSAPHVQQKGNKQWNDFFIEQEMKGIFRNIWLKPQISIHLGHKPQLKSKPLGHRGPYPIPAFNTTHVYHLFTTIRRCSISPGLPKLSYCTTKLPAPSACSPCFPPSWHHRASHHISHLSEAQHFHNLTPSHPILRALLPHTTTTSLPEISHPSQCFPSPEAQHSAFPAISHNPGSLQHTPFPLTPTAVPWPMLTPAPVRCSPLRTGPPHTQQSLPLHTGQGPPIPCTSISSGGCSHPPRCWEAWPAGKQEEFKPAKVGSRG